MRLELACMTSSILLFRSDVISNRTCISASFDDRRLNRWPTLNFSAVSFNDGMPNPPYWLLGRDKISGTQELIWSSIQSLTAFDIFESST